MKTRRRSRSSRGRFFFPFCKAPLEKIDHFGPDLLTKLLGYFDVIVVSKTHPTAMIIRMMYDASK
jgi:hypothetical protein